MKRTEFPKPFLQALIDLNSEAAFTDRGETARKAPRLLPVPAQTVSADCHKLLLEPWRKNLKIYPQIYFLVGRDIPVKDGNITAEDVLAVGLGLALTDDGIVMASPDPTPRDKHMCYWYALYSDNSQVLAEECTAGVDARSLTLRMTSPTLGETEFAQADLLFDPLQTLQETNCIVAFRKYDLISLGAAGTPVTVPADRRFLPGEKILLDGGILGKLEISVDDQRDPDYVIPTWTPRDFFLNKE